MNAGKDLFWRTVCSNHPGPIRFAPGELEEAFANSPMELRRFFVEPILARRFFRVPGVGTGEGDLRVHVEDDGQIRLETAGGEPIELLHPSKPSPRTRPW